MEWVLDWQFLFLGIVLECIRRMWPRLSSKRAPEPPNWPSVAIVVPCRDEAARLDELLPSLLAIDYPNFEIIIVDDGSTDGTGDIARGYGLKVVKTRPRPRNFMGKNWACHEGAGHASSDYLVFTDADTIHRKHSLKRAISFAIDRQVGMVSALPFHRCEKYWERLMGPFHFLLLLVTNPFLEKPKPKNLFSIGQYLLFNTKSYWQRGGHEAIASRVAEDLVLANTFAAQKDYALYTNQPALYEVQMYRSFGEFVLGWRRSFRAGISLSSKWSPLLVASVLWLMLLPFSEPRNLIFWSILLILLTLMVKWQAVFGRFSRLGIFGFPIGIATFVSISILSFWDIIFKTDYKWKGRSYRSSDGSFK